MKFLACNLIICLLLTDINIAQAQHSSQVEQEHMRGEHFLAMLNFDKIPKRKVDAETRKTVANSAWALSLPDRALNEFELAIKSSELNPEDQLIARLSQAIIHLQEQRASEALVIAKKISEELAEDSPINSKVQMLIGQSLIEMGLKNQAEHNFSLAFLHGSYQERPEIAYQLGELLSDLGRWDEAESYLKTISAEDERSDDANRLLLEINFNQRKFSMAELYLDRLTTTNSIKLRDAWLYYVRSSLAINKQDQQQLTKIQQEAHSKLAPSDPWLNMLQADYELFLARTKLSREAM